MLVKDILRKLQLGSSVAEYDQALEAYFIETEAFRSLISDNRDTIAGDKGTGKTALYKILKQRYPLLLQDVEVLAGFNPAGAPVFQRLAEGEPLEEGQYMGLWKAYIFALVGNWILEINEGAFSHNMEDLDDVLKKTGLRSADDSASTIFSQIVNLVRRFANPKSAEITTTFTPDGIPIISQRVELGDPDGAQTVPHDAALGLLNRVLAETGYRVWVVLDRLDEAFQGFPAAEIPALRALLRTYLDLGEFDHVKLKLFVRRDLFRRIIGDGFVNLTHVNARKLEIVWDEEDLFNLLCSRIRENREFVRNLGLDPATATDEELFYAVFPAQVDPGDRKPTTWRWIMSRIQDGNGIAPPRNLIDLVSKAQEAQLRREDREASEYEAGTAAGVIHPDALKRGLAALSKERVEDTLLAEAGEYAPLVERFRGSRAEHNESSLCDVLGCEPGRLPQLVKPLMEIGFLEQTRETYKVPMLYRGGLEITQGKAFESASGDVADDDDEVG